MRRFAKACAGGAPADRPELAAAAATWVAEAPSPHDLRRTTATRLAALRIPQEDRDAVLGHVSPGVGKRHYDHYGREREVRAALSTWAAALAEILSGPRERGVVVPMQR
jgi:integrase